MIEMKVSGCHILIANKAHFSLAQILLKEGVGVRDLHATGYLKRFHR